MNHLNLYILLIFLVFIYGCSSNSNTHDVVGEWTMELDMSQVDTTIPFMALGLLAMNAEGHFSFVDGNTCISRTKMGMMGQSDTFGYKINGDTLLMLDKQKNKYLIVNDTKLQAISTDLDSMGIKVYLNRN